MAGFDQNNFIGVVFLIFIMFCEVITDKSCDFDIEETLNTLFGPQDNPSIQVRALRQDLLKKLQKVSEKLEREEDENRRSLSLAKYNNFPGNKRNLESLARAGYIKTLPDQDDVDANYKRSIANLPKNGQLPMRKEEKRGIESLARYGGYKTNKDLVRPSRDYYVRNPEQSEHHSYNAKRSAKFGDPYDKPKRNEKQFGVNDYPNEGPKDIEDLRKQLLHIRYLSTLKNMGIDNNYEKDTVDIPDYDINQDSNTASTHSNYGKRFLGSVAKSGWFRTLSTPPKYPDNFKAEKRHIGSLARLGWLPSFRQTRRFNRSGRSSTADNSNRSITSDGETKINGNSEHSSISLMDGQQMYKPPEDMLFLRRVFYHPRSH